MTPDLKRLCEAAARERLTLPVTWDSEASDEPEDYEAIVRAVLTELREVSMPMYKAGGAATVHGGPYGEYNVEVGDDAAIEAFTAMIDHILAEPATA